MVNDEQRHTASGLIVDGLSIAIAVCYAKDVIERDPAASAEERVARSLYNDCSCKYAARLGCILW